MAPNILKNIVLVGQPISTDGGPPAWGQQTRGQSWAGQVAGEKGRVYFASISDIQLDVSPSKNFRMQNRTKAWGLYYFPSSWMYPLDVQNGCALEHSLKVNSVSHPMKTSHPIKKTQVHWTQKNVPHLGQCSLLCHFCHELCKKPSVKMTFPDPYHEQHRHENSKHIFKNVEAELGRKLRRF